MLTLPRLCLVGFGDYKQKEEDVNESRLEALCHTRRVAPHQGEYWLKSFCHIFTPNYPERVADFTQCDIVLHTLNK